MRIKFSEFKSIVLSKVRDVYSEKEEEIIDMKYLQEELAKSKEDGRLAEFMSTISISDHSSIDDGIENVNKILTFKLDILSKHRDTHIYDVVKELIRATKCAGFSFAKKEGSLYFGIDSTFQILEDWEIEDFILQEFFPAAKVDIKKQTVRGRDEVLNNLHAWAERLDVKKLKGK